MARLLCLLRLASSIRVYQNPLINKTFNESLYVGTDVGRVYTVSLGDPFNEFLRRRYIVQDAP